MSWSNVCVEGFCFGDKDDRGNYPCGRNCPSHLCLENEHCPHFAYGETTERRVAQFPPLLLIIKDRLGIWSDDIYWKLRWWFWDRLWFNQRKTREFFDSIPFTSAEDSPILAEYEEEERKAAVEFTEWIKGGKR